MRNCLIFTAVLLVVGAVNTERLVGQQDDMVRAHIGHVTDSFQATPNKQGLLPTASADAKVATQHAMFAAKTPDNLEAMKLHAGHVIHAVDPSVVAKGPGSGYGVKRAAAGVAQHIELAAKIDGASANVKTHATHVAASATHVAQRADEAVALAQKIQSATSAAEASKLVAELIALTETLSAGVDANKDGRISWEVSEGGLAQAEQHMAFMKKGEGL